MQTYLELTRKRLVQVSVHAFTPGNFTAIPEWAPASIEGAIEYHKKIVDYIATMPENERVKFETLKDGCGCTGRSFLNKAEEKLQRILAKRNKA